MKSHTIHANGQDIHTVFMGPSPEENPHAPALLMLHGFPENWRAWASVAQRLAGEYRLILPDQRGFNLSSKPEGVEAYHTKHLAADMLALLDALDLPQVVLCGHDWGASVAYALAMRHPERFSHLIIANGVHPVCFQKALYEKGAQRQASQYMNVLRAQGAETHMSADNYAKLFRMFEKFSTAPWLDEAKRAQFIDAWSQPGAITAMLNWYRGSPMEVLGMEAPARVLEIDDAMREKFHVPMPHLLLWGEKDTALLEDARADISAFCDDVQLETHPHASHWILHEDADWVAAQIRGFLK
ncbi:MAG: alpha/beta hydrolase [Pseudomonadota bacterium]